MPDIPWAHYTSTIVTVELPSGVLTVTPTDAPASGTLPVALSEPVHVVTAWNPGSQRLPDDENDRRNDALRRELDHRDAAWYPARGCSPDGSWCEDSFAVSGWTRPDACALARAHDQAAVFELVSGQLVVVSTTDIEQHASRPCAIAFDAA